MKPNSSLRLKHSLPGMQQQGVREPLRGKELALASRSACVGSAGTPGWLPQNVLQ